jgi:hypothetical protein
MAPYRISPLVPLGPDFDSNYAYVPMKLVENSLPLNPISFTYGDFDLYEVMNEVKHQLRNKKEA